MYRTPGAGLVLGIAAALLWSLHFRVTRSLLVAGVAPPVAGFYLLLAAAGVLLLLLFLSGRLSELSVFGRHETLLILLAGTGGYGFWLLGGMAREALPASQARLLFSTAPLLMVLFALFGPEKPGRQAAMGVLLGFVGCIMLVKGRQAGTESAAATVLWRGGALALGAAACWALFTVMARPLVREEKALPVAALVCSLGALCMLVTCLSTGQGIGGIALGQLWRALVAGALTVGMMMALWVGCIGGLAVARAAPLWYLSLAFGTLWAYRAGTRVDVWWALGGAVLVLLGIHFASAGRRREAVTIGDIIRG